MSRDTIGMSVVIVLVCSLAQAQELPPSFQVDGNFFATAPPAQSFDDMSGPGQIVSSSRVATGLGQQDPAFDRYVDMGQLRAALLSGDASLLTDLGLQLAEGERVLLRKHKSAIAAKSLFERALAVSKDDETLERLAKAAKHMEDESLATEIQEARKPTTEAEPPSAAPDPASAGAPPPAAPDPARAGAPPPPRAPDPALVISPELTDVETFILLKRLLALIDEAKVLRNKSLLEQANRLLASADSTLSPAQHAAIEKLIEDARASLPEGPSAVDDAIRRLVGHDHELETVSRFVRFPPIRDPREDIDTIGRNPLVPPGSDEYQVRLRNASNFTIFACVVSTTNTDVGRLGRSFGWYRIRPGGQATTGRIKSTVFFVYAETDDNVHSPRTFWSGRFNRQFRGRTLPMDRVDRRVPRPDTHTYTFN